MMHVRTAALAATFALVCAGVAVMVPARASAQATSISLGAIDTLLARSRFRDAAAALDAWEREHVSRITAAERATALLLRARMTQDGDSARSVYQSLSLGYPSSPEAPVALLRLGQLAAASGDAVRAKSYFQRVVTDYPTSPVRDEAVDWLAKANSGAGVAPMIAAAKNAATPPKNTATPPKNTPTSTPPVVTLPRTSTASAATASAATASAATGAFALQVGAFREASTAATVARQLAQRGFEARVVAVPGSTLARVRVGKFVTSRATEDTMRRLKSAGYEAVVVDDARAETDASK